MTDQASLGRQIVWRTVQDELPSIRRQLRKIVDERKT